LILRRLIRRRGLGVFAKTHSSLGLGREPMSHISGSLKAEN
jgi:hypothetical protein